MSAVKRQTLKEYESAFSRLKSGVLNSLSAQVSRLAPMRNEDDNRTPDEKDVFDSPKLKYRKTDFAYSLAEESLDLTSLKEVFYQKWDIKTGSRRTGLAFDKKYLAKRSFFSSKVAGMVAECTNALETFEAKYPTVPEASSAALVVCKRHSGSSSAHSLNTLGSVEASDPPLTPWELQMVKRGFTPDGMALA